MLDNSSLRRDISDTPVRGTMRKAECALGDDADTSVIGVILLVMISVSLAALVASIAFNMAAKDLKTRDVAVTATQQGTDVVVIWQGGTDTDQVHSYEIFVNNQIRASNLHADAGNYTILSLDKPGGMNRVMVTAYFVDGAGLVVLDTYV